MKQNTNKTTTAIDTTATTATTTTEETKANPLAPAPRAKTRRGTYDAKAQQLLTEKNGFQRHGWEGSTVVTDKERALLDAAWDLLVDKQPEDGSWSFSDVSVGEVADHAGLEVSQVWGALSVLTAKGLAYVVRSERLVPNKQGQLTKKEKTAFFHLRPRAEEVLGR